MICRFDVVTHLYRMYIRPVWVRVMGLGMSLACSSQASNCERSMLSKYSFSMSVGMTWHHLDENYSSINRVIHHTWKLEYTKNRLSSVCFFGLSSSSAIVYYVCWVLWCSVLNRICTNENGFPWQIKSSILCGCHGYMYVYFELFCW